MSSDIPKKNQKVRSKQKMDDLTIVPGIDEPLRQWMNASLDVYTFNDLTMLSVKRASEVARREGRVLPVNVIKSMIAFAKKQVTEEKLNIADKLIKTNNKVQNRKDWDEVATIVVYVEENCAKSNNVTDLDLRYRTSVHHIESGEEVNWPGLDVKNVCEWLNIQLDKLVKSMITDQLSVDSQTRIEPLIKKIDLFLLRQLPVHTEVKISEENKNRSAFIQVSDTCKIKFIIEFIDDNINSDLFRSYLSGITVEQQHANMVNDIVVKSISSLADISQLSNFIWTASLPLISSTIGVYEVKMEILDSFRKKIYNKLYFGLLHVM